MSNSKVWNSLFSDLFINLSAGWFGSALIVPVFSSGGFVLSIPILTIDLILGIVCLLFSYSFRIKIWI